MGILWCYWHHYECKGRAEKAFRKWLLGMSATRLQSLAEVYSCTRRLLGKKCSLNGCTVLYFSEIKWFGVCFETTMLWCWQLCFSRWLYSILITNLMHGLLFIHKIIFSSTCFEPQVLIFRRIQLCTCSIWYCHSLWEFLVACRYTAWVRTDCGGKVVGRAS